MKPDNQRKIERQYNKAIDRAEERQKKGFFEGAALAYLEAAKLSSQDIYSERLLACFHNASLAYIEARKFVEAEKYLQRSLSIAKKIFDEKHPYIAIVLNNLGTLYVELTQLDRAKECFQQAFDIRLETFGKNHPDTINALNNLGGLYADKGEHETAEQYFKQAKEFIGNASYDKYKFPSELIAKNQENLQKKVTQLEREKLETQAALYQTKKLEYLGQMATLMAHNINQPIAIMRLAASGALSDVNDKLFNSDTELKPLLEKLLKQTERLSEMMSNFRNFARGDRAMLTAVNLNDTIEDIYQLLFVAQYQLDKIELQKHLIEAPIAHANEWALQEMLISLLSNARAAVIDKPDKKVGIKTWREGSKVGFCVEDSGDGVDSENLPKLFTPFLSSKQEGMGLGLYFCREIVKDLGGSIEYYPAPLGGAGFKITLNATG